MELINRLSFAQRQRLQYIEAVAYWEGLVRRPRVSRVFGVSENHITRDFAFYRRMFPNNLDYDVSVRAYRPGRRFRPTLSSGSPDEYLSLLRAFVEGHATAVLPSVGDGVEASTLPTPRAPVDSKVLVELTRALRQGYGVRITYQSMNRPEPRGRIVWPHALVYAGSRWHVRAYDSRRSAFGDFVLQRIADPRPLHQPCPVPITSDEDWMQEEVVEVTPATMLSPDQARAIAKEYGMNQQDGVHVWRATMRRCLVPYFLYWLRLDADTPSSGYIRLLDPSIANRYRLDQAF